MTHIPSQNQIKERNTGLSVGIEVQQAKFENIHYKTHCDIGSNQMKILIIPHVHLVHI